MTGREPTSAQAYKEPETAHAHSQPDTAESYRKSSGDQTDVVFVFLKGSESLLRERMSGRDGHFMPSELLTSQLEALEKPCSDERHVVVDISRDVESLVKEIYTYIRSLSD